MLEFTPEEVAELFGLLTLLEVYAATLAGRRAQPNNIEKLRQIRLVTMRRLASQELTVLHEEDLAFHRKIIELAVNPFFTWSVRAARLPRQVF